MLFDYQSEYLNSSLWKKIRKRILLRDGKKCVFCGGVAKAVHHRSYSREVLEGLADDQLVSLCDPCHEYIHFAPDGFKHPPDETDRILLSAQPPTDFPEPTVDLRHLPYRELPGDWSRMNHIQRKGWHARYIEVRRAKRAELTALQQAREERQRQRRRDPSDPWISLREAVELYRREKDAPSNSYNWYRESAMRNGCVSIGDTKVPTEKRGWVWSVRREYFLAAISRHHERLLSRAKVTEDYRVGILHGSEGENIETDWGHYRRQGNFHVAFSLHAQLRRGDGESVHCNECFKAACQSPMNRATPKGERCSVCGQNRQ